MSVHVSSLKGIIPDITSTIPGNYDKISVSTFTHTVIIWKEANMKVLLFSEGMNLIKISGLGRAIMHQQRAMELNGIEYTLDPKDSYDVVHINTLGTEI